MHNSVVVVNPVAVLYQYWFQKSYCTIDLGIRPRFYTCRNFLGSFVGPHHFSTSVKTFEILIQYLLQIRTNWEDVQEINMILLDCYCTLTYTNVSLAFFASFGFACKQQLIVNYEMLKEMLLL